MQINLIRAFARSAVFELDHPTVVDAPVPYTVTLNGKTVLTGQTRNVFSLHHLSPSTQYTIAIDGVSLTFTTAPEHTLLDVRRFGAAGDGQTVDTAAIQAAIACCPQGGTVFLPAGVYLSGPLFLKSHMTLLLDKGAVLLGRPQRMHYPILPGVTPTTDERDEVVLGAWEGNPLDSFAALINGIGVTDVCLCGEGIIDANAHNGDWWQNPKQKRGAWRPRVLFLNECENIAVHGLTFQNAYAWTLHPFFSKHLLFADIRIQNPDDSPNTDGLNPEACEDVQIIGAHISVGDDCIALKSAKLYLARKRGRTTRDITIRNCVFARGHGGVVIGSEIAGGIQNVHISQCRFTQTDRGLRIKTRRGRGDLCVIDGIHMQNVTMDGVMAMLVVNMYYFCDPDGHSPYVQSRAALPVDDFTPRVGSITLQDVTCTRCGAAGVFVYALPEQPMGSLTMRNVSIHFDPSAPPAQPAMMDGVADTKGQGIFARHIHTLALANVTLQGHTGEPLDMADVTHFTQEG